MDYGVVHTKKCSLALKYAESHLLPDGLAISLEGISFNFGSNIK